MGFNTPEDKNFEAKVLDLIDASYSRLEGLNNVEQMRLLSEMVNNVAGLLAANSDTYISSQALKFLDRGRISKYNKGGIVMFATVDDYSLAMTQFLEKINVPPQYWQKEFLDAMPGVNQPTEEQPPTQLLFRNMPVNPMMHQLKGRQLTSFQLIQICFLHLNNLRLNVGQRLENIVAFISIVADYIDLAFAVGSNQVEIGQINELYDLIMYRAGVMNAKVLDLAGLTEDALTHTLNQDGTITHATKYGFSASEIPPRLEDNYRFRGSEQ